MQLDLKNKICLITGSTSGIGLAIAKKLLDEKAIIYINGRDEQKMKDVLSSLKSEYPNIPINGIIADLSKVDGVEKVIKMLPKIDILINNVGFFEPKSYSDLTESDWNDSFNVNFRCSEKLSKHYVKDMLSNGWGRIIFISSASGIHIQPNLLPYGAAKAAQLTVSEGLAKTTIYTGVTVNVVAPGPTWTEGARIFIKKLATQRNESFEDTKQNFFKIDRPNSKIKRWLSVDEVANLVIFLVSPLASGINGQIYMLY
ncbi:SDR family NAD(P)-dependent oxidoreductase [Emticicia sp. SJ17W-69]|uniref:SDR family NAD(P)-dependent oxidoreductase n=1 Tax=Emticicia sp. SJ17W-69 TaxID=3421657 RepID=UPI003EBE5B7D